MIRFPTLAFAALAAAASALPAGAQEPMMMKDGQVMMMMPDGRMSTMTMTDEKMMGTAMEGAQPVAGGTLFLMRDGKLYMAPDRKMESGMMMSEEMMKQ